MSCPRLCVTSEVESHEVYLVLMDQKSIKDIGFSVSRTLYADLTNYTSLPARVVGVLANWVLKKEFKIRVEYPQETPEGGVTPHDI